MVVEIMGKPLEKMKRIRSLDEILTRGGQAFTAYRDQMFGGADVPSDEEFVASHRRRAVWKSSDHR